MKKILLISLLIAISVYQWLIDTDKTEVPFSISSDNATFEDYSNKSSASSNVNEAIIEAYKQHQSDVQVNGFGKVVHILPDDNKGLRHQKFILQVPLGPSILIAHNIDLAPRIKSLSKADKVEFYGEYEWNKKGGVVHWTHKDPGGRHIDGWLKHNGKMHQ